MTTSVQTATALVLFDTYSPPPTYSWFIARSVGGQGPGSQWTEWPLQIVAKSSPNASYQQDVCPGGEAKLQEYPSCRCWPVRSWRRQLVSFVLVEDAYFFCLHWDMYNCSMPFRSFTLSLLRWSPGHIACPRLVLDSDHPPGHRSWEITKREVQFDVFDLASAGLADIDHLATCRTCIFLFLSTASLE